MSLADALVSHIAPTANLGCPVAGLLDSLTAEDADALRAAMEPGRVNAVELHALMRAEGVTTVTIDALRRHKATIARARGHYRKAMPCACPSETL